MTCKTALYEEIELGDVAPLAIRVQGFTLEIFGDHIQNREGRFSGVWLFDTLLDPQC